MSSTWYVEKIVLPNGTQILGVPSDPNGVQQAPIGSVAAASDGTGPYTNTDGAVAWSAAGASPTEYYVDPALTVNVGLWRYPTVSAAVVAGHTDGNIPVGGTIPVRVKAGTQDFWDGTGFDGTRALTVRADVRDGSRQNSGDNPTTHLSLQTLSGATGFGEIVRFQNLVLTIFNPLDFDTSGFVASDCWVTGNSTTQIKANGIWLFECNIHDVSFYSTGIVGDKALKLYNSHWLALISTTNYPDIFLSDGQIHIIGGSVDFGSYAGAGTVVMFNSIFGTHWSNVAITPGANAGVSVMQVQAGATATQANGVIFTPQISGGGSVVFGTGGVGGNVGVIWYGFPVPVDLPPNTWVRSIAGAGAPIVSL